MVINKNIIEKINNHYTKANKKHQHRQSEFAKSSLISMKGRKKLNLIPFRCSSKKRENFHPSTQSRSCSKRQKSDFPLLFRYLM